MATTEKNKTTSSEKMIALKLTIDRIEKGFGKGNVMLMNEKAISEIECVFR